MDQNSVTRSNGNRSGVYVSVAALVGYIAAVVWGKLAYSGDLPFAPMLVGLLLLGFPAAVYAGYLGRSNSGWVGWAGVALVFLAVLVGSLLGIVIASD